jgi:hypothetical protein
VPDGAHPDECEGRECLPISYELTTEDGLKRKCRPQTHPSKPISDSSASGTPGVTVGPSERLWNRFTTNARDLPPVPAQHNSPAVEVVSSMWIPEYRKSGFPKLLVQFYYLKR